MDFSLSQNQTLIRKSAREFFENECPKEKTRSLIKDPIGYDRSMWQKMVELGFVGIQIPDEFGGMQGEFLELEILMEEMGRSIVPGPYFETVCMCAPALMAFGTGEQKRKFLPGIAEKGTIWTFALDETFSCHSSQSNQVKARETDQSFVLSGTKLFVPYANTADQMLVAARTRQEKSFEDGITVFIVDAHCPGIEIEEMPTAAPGLKCEVRFNNVNISRDSHLGHIGGGAGIVDQMVQHAGVLKAAEMAGGAASALEIALKYAKERIQFNRPIGSFQVMQHKLVKMLQEVDGLRHLVREAAWRINAGESSPILNAMAKVKANNAYHRVCFDAVVIHGAIGWTAEMDVSLYLLRSKDLENDCGGTDFHREIVARELDNCRPDFLAINA